MRRIVNPLCALFYNYGYYERTALRNLKLYNSWLAQSLVICQEEEEVGEEAKDVRATVLNTNFWGHAKKMRKENVVSDTA